MQHEKIIKIKLIELISEINIDGLNDIINEHLVINGLSLHSNQIKPGYLFIACSGSKYDGCNYIDLAINRGAVAILYEKEDFCAEKKVPLIFVKHLSQHISNIAAKFYGYPSRKLLMIGVTGTNGKTTITQCIANIMTNLGTKCGVIGTIGSGFLNSLHTSINTTPDAISIQKLLYTFVNNGAKAVAMEISSHGLCQGRINNIDFDIGIFTNLTHEHLDYHKTMKEYGNAKKIFFLNHNLKYAIINIDDKFGLEIINDIKLNTNTHIYTYTLCPQINKPIEKKFNIIADKINFNFDMTSANIKSPWGNYLLKCKLIGNFNISNALSVMCVLGISKFDLNKVILEFEKLNFIKGRMEVIDEKSFATKVIIDYAHTPSALKQVLLSLRKYCKKNLWCVFGCGGERDTTKRAKMGKIAEQLSNKIIITNDNPRNENEIKIVNDILKGIVNKNNVIIKYDRKEAIYYAINNSSIDDIVLLAGKGHENYQIIGSKKNPFSDKMIALEAIKNKLNLNM